MLTEIANTHDPVVLSLVADLINATDPTAKGIAADALARHGGFDAVANLLRVAGLQEGMDARAIVLEGLNAVSDAEGFMTLASTLAATRDLQFIDAVVKQLARTSDPVVLSTMVELYRERNDAPFQEEPSAASHRVPAASRSREGLGQMAHSASEPALVAAAEAALQQL